MKHPIGFLADHPRLRTLDEAIDDVLRSRLETGQFTPAEIAEWLCVFRELPMMAAVERVQRIQREIGRDATLH